MKIEIVMFSGKQGSGKSTAVKELRRQLAGKKGWRVEELNFADPLYRMHDFCRGVLEDAGVDTIHKVKDGNLLQLLGTEWGRTTIDSNVWVKVAQGTISKMSDRVSKGNAPDRLIFLISDCRFENEFHAFPDALRVRLECPREVRKERCSMWRENDQHPSEIGLDWFSEAGIFDLSFDTSTFSAEHVATLIAAKLLKGEWAQKRNNQTTTEVTVEKERRGNQDTGGTDSEGEPDGEKLRQGSDFGIP